MTAARGAASRRGAYPCSSEPGNRHRARSAPDRNLAWAKELELPFRLLSDVTPAGQVGKRYGVWDDLWRIERRATFIVDRHGKVRWTESGGLCIDTSRALDARSKLARER